MKFKSFGYLLFLYILFINEINGQFCLTPNTTGLYLSDSYSCDKGFYCPNTTPDDPYSLPQLCPPTIDCQLERLFGKFCEPQGLYEPTPCPAGYYCPTFREKIECPEGYYCPLGSYETHECPPLSSCPAGSNTPFFYGALVSVIIVDLFLISLFFYYRFHLKRKHATERVKGDEALASQIRPSKFNFRFDQLRYQLDTGKVILNGVTGEIRSGRVTAIMGPSGSGKTTFLSVLMGKVARTSGKLYINEKEEEMYKFKKVIGYVPQDDIMLRELTVRENISFSAKIRLPSSWKLPRIKKLVDTVINSLNLSAVENSQIGDENKRGVSGGQRKRVNIGIELAASPSVVFLDEPTSGLDATQALQVANIMKQLAQIGMTVAAVIHQPRYEIFKSFDDIILLCPGGKVAYIGPLTQCEAYFNELGYKFDPRENPADVLMDIISGNKQTENGQQVDLEQAWSSRSSNITSKEPSIEQFEVVSHNEPENSEQISIDTNDAVSIKHKNAPIWKQIILNHNRYLLQQYRTINSFIIEIGVACLAGLLIGISVMGSAGELFKGVLISPYTLISAAPAEWLLPLFGLLVGISVGMSGAPAGVKTFGEEKFLYWREAAAGHNKIAYFIGKTICTFYRFSVTSLHFAMFYYILARPLISFGKFYFLIFLTFYSVYGLATIVSMLVRRENSSLLAVVICLFAAVFNGFGPSLKDARAWGISFIWEISYGRWVTEALYNEEVKLFRHLYQVDNLSAKNWGYGLDRYAMDVGVIIVIGIVYRIVAFVLMIVMNRRKTK